IFEHPPTSTAQIIHPKKYLNNVQPIDVQFPDLAAALGAGWQQLEKDVLGEIDHRILIQQFLNRDIADRAADGWAGDAYALLGNGDQVAVVVSSRWDTAADASEWFDAYSQAMRARYGSRLAVVDERPDRVAWRTPDGMQALKRSGTSTVILIASTPDQIARRGRAPGPDREARRGGRRRGVSVRPVPTSALREWLGATCWRSRSRPWWPSLASSSSPSCPTRLPWQPSCWRLSTAPATSF